MAITLRIRRDTAANWTSVNPVLALGEPALETDTKKTKYGDGATAWTSLPYSLAADATNRLAVAANLGDLASPSTARTNLGLGTLATQNGTFSGTSSGTNTGDQASVSGNAGTATKLATPRNLAMTGDIAWTAAAFDGSSNVTAAAVLVAASSAPTYATDALAGIGGLTSGQVYKTDDGLGGFYLKIKS